MTGAHPMDVNIAGHEGIGDVVQLGRDVQALRLGQRVGVKWIHETCGVCEVCKRDSTLCSLQHNSGRDRDGTLQQYVTVPANHATPIPEGIRSEIAAPLLCGESYVLCQSSESGCCLVSLWSKTAELANIGMFMI